jgi:hypothetical protein
VQSYALKSLTITVIVSCSVCSETKIVDKASQHMQNTAQRFDDENALMSSCFFNLEDDIYEYERHAARLHLIRNAAAIEAVARLNSVSDAETKLRAAEDVEVLDTVIETQGLLQQTVSIACSTALLQHSRHALQILRAHASTAALTMKFTALGCRSAYRCYFISAHSLRRPTSQFRAMTGADSRPCRSSASAWRR